MNKTERLEYILRESKKWENAVNEQCRLNGYDSLFKKPRGDEYTALSYSQRQVNRKYN